MIEFIDVRPEDPLLIAEIGSNWRKYANNGRCIKHALDQIYRVKEAGFNAVKFQMFTQVELYGEDGGDMFSLPRSWIPVLFQEAKKNELEFLCSAFSLDGYKFVNQYVNWHKIACPENEMKDIIKYVKSTLKPYIISIDKAGPIENPLIKRIELTCVSEYPAKIKDYRLDIGRGISDHTCSLTPAQIGPALAWKCYEVHVDLLKPNDAEINPPDNIVSIPFHVAKEYCKLAREVPLHVDNPHRRMNGFRPKPKRA